MEYHIAQVNIAIALDELDSIRLSSFVARISEINAIAEQAPGYIWRLQTNSLEEQKIRDLFGEERLVFNLSLWQNIESLKNFVYKSMHLELLKNKNEWFNSLSHSHQALWWIEKGKYPTVEEAKDKLELLDRSGVSEEVFTFSAPQPDPKVLDKPIRE